MIVERCADQGSESLEIALRDWGKRGDGKPLLDLIETLRALPDSRRVWVLLAQPQIHLLARNTRACPRYVTITVPSYGGFQVEYLMPANEAPWAKAHVRGETSALDEAATMTVMAMGRSEGWSR